MNEATRYTGAKDEQWSQVDPAWL